MQKIIDNALWGLLLLFIIPTMLIMGSWNSYPGDPMYAVKLALERTLLFFVRPSFAAEAALNLTYTDRRVSDATVLLANNNSTKGLSYLSAQVSSTTQVINRAPNQMAKKKIASEYITKLKDVNVTLEQQKQVAIETTSAKPWPQVTSGQTIARGQGIRVMSTTTTPAPIVASTSETATAQIAQAQTVIEQNIQELETIINAPDSVEMKDKEDKKSEEDKKSVEDKKSDGSDTRGMSGEARSADSPRRD